MLRSGLVGAVVAGLWLCGCGGDGGGSAGDGGRAGDGGGGPSDASTLADAGPVGDAALAEDAALGPRIFIHVAATAATFPHSDGLSGQTPRLHRNGIRSFQLLRNMGDPQPLHVFDHGDGFVEASYDDGADTVVGSARAASLTAGTYTVGRVVLSHVRYQVDSTLHAGGFDIPGRYDNVQVLSERTTLDGTARARGWFRYVFTGGASSYPLEGVGGAPVPTGPTGSSLVTALEGGELALYFPVQLVVNPAVTSDVHEVIEFNVDQCFRWQDQTQAGYQPAVFDSTPSGYEPVLRFGANSFRVFQR
ncbi:MAG: hypothetical protein IT370_35480 [Deltaproteobacteria bacterium]|nr:hypothetical protein [Deltaproteobacteria bacterium]